MGGSPAERHAPSGLAGSHRGTAPGIAIPAPDRSPVPAPDRSPLPAPDRSPVPAPDRSPVPAPDRSPVPAPDRSPVLPRLTAAQFPRLTAAQFPRLTAARARTGPAGMAGRRGKTPARLGSLTGMRLSNGYSRDGAAR